MAAKKSAAKKAATKVAKKATGKKPAAKRMGRPPKGDASRGVVVSVRLTEAEKRMLDECAEVVGLSLADTILAAVRAFRPH